MGGAERGEAKRKRKAAQTVTAPRSGGRPDRRRVAAVVVAAALAVAVGIGLLVQYLNQPAALPEDVPLAAAGVEYQVTLRDDTIVTGLPQAPVTIDVYEDFLCAGCGQFEKLYHQQLAQAAADGKARVVYHPVAILDEASAPPGYSTLAVGATLCAAEAGIFPRFHYSLFATQPTMGGPRWSSAQLERLGRDLGAGDGFARCVQTGAEQRVSAATESARRYVSGLRSDGKFGTPSVVVNGALVDIRNTRWLDQALGNTRR